MKRRIFSMVCSITLIASMLSGCGSAATTESKAESGNTKSSTESSTEASTGASSAVSTAASTAVSKAETSTTSSGDDLKGTKITFLNTKTEIQDYLEDMAAEFEKETGITVECYTNTEENHISEKYASGEPYNITMMDYPDVADYQQYLYDLSNEDWVKDGGDKYGLTLDGKVMGFPFVIEAMGMIYNADAIEKITGETFNWEDYSTLKAFSGLLEKLKAGGMEAPVAVNKDDWSLASHVAGQYYCLRDDGTEKASLSFIDELKKGTADVAKDANYNALMDTIDTFLKYNINASDPLSASYDTNDEYLADGKVAFWPNGSWATDVSKNTDKIGIMPYPVDTEDTSLSQKLISGATKMLTVDAAYSTEKEQQASLKFLNWLVYSDAGQDFMVNKCSLIVAFSNIKLEASTPLSSSVFEFIKNGQTNYWYQALPSDYNTAMGAILQQYIAGATKRDQLASDIESYWKGK